MSGTRTIASPSRFVLLVAASLLMLLGASLASADGLVHPDGRLNQVAHFGGDAFYCVDENMLATNSYPEMIDGGGFRLLDIGGQEWWFVPADVILAKVEESIATKSWVEVAAGRGTYGPVRLHTYFDGKEQVFVFSGYDEHGKPNSFEFKSCTPASPVPGSSDSNGSGDVIICIIDPSTNPGNRGKLISPVEGDDVGPSDPCDECPPAPPGGGAKRAYRPASRNAGNPSGGGGGDIRVECRYEPRIE